MSKRTKSGTRGKADSRPDKPHADFPLFAHANGRWAKKVLGKLVYFGKWSTDPDGKDALEKWLDQKDELLAGRKPRVKGDGVNVGHLCNRFLSAKETARAAGKITERTLYDYRKVCQRLTTAFGTRRLVSDLGADDFEHLEKTILKRGVGLVALGNDVRRTRVVFKYGLDAGLIDHLPRYGQSFKAPGATAMRRERQARAPKMWEAAELRRIVESAEHPMRAMILLGVNCGLGNSDIAKLRFDHLDLSGGWLDYPRPKTAVARRAKLWSETVAALNEAIAARPTPKDERYSDRVFITKYGNPWGNGSPTSPVGHEFRKLIDDLKLHKPGLGFYSLRHVFRTVADATRDYPAVNMTMGHADNTMGAVYRERIDDSRLAAVAEHVRAWLFAPATKDEGQDEGAKATKGTTTKDGTTKAKRTRKQTERKSAAPVDERPALRVFVG